jgi:eukaryotic-like serine/threonine-protein kinase
MGWLDKLQSMFGGGQRVDIHRRFELLSEGYVGTMSRFHRARDREHDRIVGLKLCDVEKTGLFETRFAGLQKPTEGEIALSMKHERIVETFESGVSVTGQPFIVMEFLPGPGLQQLVREHNERLVGRRLNLIRQMAEAVLAVHRAGYIHRDICPRNFICSPELDSLKLIDFGLTLPDLPEFRKPGNRTGTPMYMAPEIVRRRSTDQRVDVFAFGVTAYELLAFQLPWPWAEATGRGALTHDSDDPVPILEIAPQLNRTLAAAVSDCLFADREKRPQSLEVFLNRIRRVQSELEE